MTEKPETVEQIKSWLAATVDLDPEVIGVTGDDDGYTVTLPEFSGSEGFRIAAQVPLAAAQLGVPITLDETAMRAAAERQAQAAADLAG